MVRLKDIAEQAGVAVMTVSRVLRDSPDISAATKERVRRIALELGYVPNTTARGLRMRASRLLGAAVASLADPFVTGVLGALEAAAQKEGYELLVAQHDGLAEREDQCLRQFWARRAEGVIVLPAVRLTGETPLFRRLHNRQLRVVMLGPPPAFCEELPAVTVDNPNASALATRHLLGLGHQRIAFFAGPAGSVNASERLAGYKRALREARLEPDDALVFKAGRSREDGQRAALQMLDEGPRITAIQAVNDLVAIGAAEVLLKQGLRIPGDLSLVGFGDLPVAEFYRVPLTTVRYSQQTLGTEAMRVLLSRGHERGPKIHFLEGELVVRASSAVPLPRPALLIEN